MFYDLLHCPAYILSNKRYLRILQLEVRADPLACQLHGQCLPLVSGNCALQFLAWSS